jgi:hypothetical protein
MSDNGNFFYYFYHKLINIFANWQSQYRIFSEICTAYKFHKSDDGGTFRWYNESSAFFILKKKFSTIHSQFCVVFQNTTPVVFRLLG